MPNGGSDCCGTCWFNAKNKGEAGYGHSKDPEPDRCVVRELDIEDPFYTYCANHPHRNPGKIRVPIGPVYVFAGDYQTNARTVWVESPDNEAVRKGLLQLARQVVELGSSVLEYPIGLYLHEVVIWQLGELGETRAVPDLERIAASHSRAGELAKEALAKIRQSS